MHGTYAFLISVPESYSLKGKAEHARTVFERDYVPTHTDENNWHEICGVITKDGDSYNFFSRTVDWRGREAIIPDFTTGKRKEEIWDGIIDFSFDVLKHDLTVSLGLWRDGEEKESVPSCKKELVSFLDKQITEISKSGKVWWMNPAKIGELNAKDRTVINQEVENCIDGLNKIKNCILSSRFGVFSRTMTTPYDYRCFDLRDAAETEKVQDVVLLVDIHT